jgi:hypothetical protein
MTPQTQRGGKLRPDASRNDHPVGQPKSRTMSIPYGERSYSHRGAMGRGGSGTTSTVDVGWAVFGSGAGVRCGNIKCIIHCRSAGPAGSVFARGGGGGGGAAWSVPLRSSASRMRSSAVRSHCPTSNPENRLRSSGTASQPRSGRDIELRFALARSASASACAVTEDAEREEKSAGEVLLALDEEERFAARRRSSASLYVTTSGAHGSASGASSGTGSHVYDPRNASESSVRQ